MTLTCLGAARTVTGSKHLLETNGQRILVDSGLFQGLKELRERNWQELPVRANSIASVVLTHAHLDHCGYLPRLVGQGFRGRIFCTPSTADLAAVVMADAAHLQEEDAERANRKGYSKHKPALPLFTTADADRAITQLQPVGYHRRVPVAPGIEAEFINAGHLLGSAYARVTVAESRRTMLFGGDLGRYGRPVLPDPSPVDEADVLLVESTYGDRVHEQDDNGLRVASIISETAKRGGKLVIPSFALGRVEELLYWIRRLEHEKRIPILPVYVDSPMAATVLQQYRARAEELDPDIIEEEHDAHRARNMRDVCAFCTAKLKVVTSIAESKAVQESREPSIIISASGMATGGRVLHHLARVLPGAHNTVMFAGYQAAGTRGRQLKDGAKFTRIHGQDVPVAARIEAIDSMSAHADANEIMRWLGNFKRPPALTCLVHGEPAPMDALKARIERELRWTVKTPMPAEKNPTPMSRKYLLEQVDDVAVVQLYADSFEGRPLNQKILIWHLYQAAIAGRDIYYDQRYQHALDMREVLEEILRHPEGIQPDVFDAIRRYTKLFWINSGPHNNLTARKFVPSCTPEQFIAAARTAERAGAAFPYKDGEAFDGFFAFMRPLFFDHNVDTMVTNKTPAEGCDILADSANNLYDGVWSRDLVGFEEKYGLNSRLVKRDGQLQEEVYRLGGRYSQIIGRIVRHLRDAMPYAPPPMHKALDALVRFYISGEDADRVEYDIAWVADRESPVDTINGFVENYMDARGVKGAWEALVFVVNLEKTTGLRALAANAGWFEERMPYDDQWRREDVVGVSARAIDVIVETGDSGPLTPIGINLPNDQRIRERYGSKSVTIANVNEAYEKSQLPSYRQEFCWSADEVARAEKWGAIASEVTTGIHEVLGHGSGRVAERLEGQPQLVLKEQYSALEESRADLIALYFMPDPKIAELGLLPGEHQTEIVQAEYESYARNALVQLRRVREGSQLEEDHMRNRQMIVNWLLAHTSAIEIRRRDHKTYYVMVDANAFHNGVGRLLREVQRIKSEGDYDAARSLFEEHGIFFEPALRDEVVERVDRIKLPSYTGFVQPRLQPVMGDNGQITDVTISYPEDLEKQMLEYSGKVTA